MLLTQMGGERDVTRNGRISEEEMMAKEGWDMYSMSVKVYDDKTCE